LESVQLTFIDIDTMRRICAHHKQTWQRYTAFAVLITATRSRFDVVRLSFDCNSTTLRPFDDLFYDPSVGYCTAAEIYK